MKLREALLSAAWLGILTGLLEIVALTLRKLVFGRMTWVSDDFVWMIPAANVFVALVLAVLALLAVAVLTKLGRAVNAFTVVIFFVAAAGFMDLLLYVPGVHHYALTLLALGLGLQTARLLTRHAAGFMRFSRRTAPWMLALVVGLTVAIHGERLVAERRAIAALPSPLPGTPNVLFIVIDTARAANFSLYGYARKTTPRIDRLGERGAVFDRAIATAPWTLPSHASMFTGRWANELSSTWRAPLDATYPTLAEALSARGYATAGFVANLHYTSREVGLARGFTHFEDYPVSLGQLAQSSALVRTAATNFRLRRFLKNDELLSRVPADEINRRLLAWLASRDSSRPFFVFLNYFDAHLPYLPPPPFDREFGPPAAGKQSLLSRWAVHPRRNKPSARDIAAGMVAYDGALAYVDSRIGALVDELARQGLLDKTVVVVTADHGEEFGEHGLFGHGDSLYLPSVHVPLVISYPPRVPARRIVEPVTLRDLTATVIDLTGVSVAPVFPGRSLARLWAEPGAGNREPALSELQRPPGVIPTVPVARGNMTSLTGTDRRYIRNGDGIEELYDVDHDYWETRDLAGLESGRETLTEFRGVLGRLSPDTVHAERAKP